MKLKIETPMASDPIVAAESVPQCPAMAVLTMPISGTVMFDTMFGTAIRRISRFMVMYGGKDTANSAKMCRPRTFLPKSGAGMDPHPKKCITFAATYDYFIMRDFKNDSTDALSRFGRDRRVRTAAAATERVERGPRPQRDAADSGRSSYRGRASYNPNFTADNRPVQSGRPARGSEGRPAYGERGRSYADKPAYGAKSGSGDRKSGPKRYGDRPAPGDRGRGYGDRPAYGEKRGCGAPEKFGGKPSCGKPRKGFRRSDKPAGDYPRYNPGKQIGEMRLNRYIAQSGICSRREADDFIQAGLVSVNGRIVTELGTKVMPNDEVRFNDSRVQGEKKVYLVLNKPKGYVTTLDDPHADKTVMELVKGACTERIYPVGRLDKNSVGLLLFTNDGDLTRQLTHPSYRKKKIYQVTLDKALERADMEAIAEGITLEDGEIHADEIAYVKDDRKEIGIEIHSGRNRIVRRIFEHLGYTVQKLDRVYYAGLTKKNLKRGAWRFLTREEVERLKSGQYE